MPKKLKVVVKSLYSHEIRRDVHLEGLKSLKLIDAWPFMREEIELEIGSNKFVCIPHITEAELYKAGSLFVEDCDNGMKAMKPIGELGKWIDLEKTESSVAKSLQTNFIDTGFKFPHESVKITLQDEIIKNKVRVIMINFSRAVIPKDKKDLVGKVKLRNDGELEGKKKVYMITDVLMAKTVEFRVTRGTSSRIFHLGTATPLVFVFEELTLDDTCTIVAREPVKIDSEQLSWTKVDPSDHLYKRDERDALATTP